MPRHIKATWLACLAMSWVTHAHAELSMENLAGRYETDRQNCVTQPSERLFGSYLTVEAKPEPRLLSGAYEGEGGSCEVLETADSRWVDTPAALTIEARCREEESEPSQSRIDLVTLFGGRSLIMRRTSGDWASQRIYHRCDRVIGYDPDKHDPPLGIATSSTGDRDQEANWARPFICSYASGGTELSRGGCARQTNGEPEVMVWDNGNVVSVVDRGNGAGLLNARTARVETRDGGTTTCWIIDRTTESFCRQELR
ncbi:MAG: hypothetical protein AAFY73_03185 [Pseudomonadota bacterium]